MIHRIERSGSNGKPRQWRKKHKNPTHCWHTGRCVLLTIPTDAFSRYANFMRVASVFAWGVGGRRLNKRTDATQRPMHLTAENVWLIGKESMHVFLRLSSPPLGCTTAAASAPAWRSPTWLLSCRFCGATKSPPLYPWIWITNTLRTYICEIQLILPPSERWEEACLSGRLLFAAPGNLSDVGRLRENTRKPGEDFRRHVTNVEEGKHPPLSLK